MLQECLEGFFFCQIKLNTVRFHSFSGVISQSLLPQIICLTIDNCLLEIKRTAGILMAHFQPLPHFVIFKLKCFKLIPKFQIILLHISLQAFLISSGSNQGAVSTSHCFLSLTIKNRSRQNIYISYRRSRYLN